MENISLSLLNESEKTISDEFQEENSIDQHSYNNRCFENDDENIDEKEFENKKRQNPTRKSKNARKRLKNVNSNTSPQNNIRKRSIKRKSSVQHKKNELNNGYYNDTNINNPKRKRKRSIHKMTITTTEKEDSLCNSTSRVKRNTKPAPQKSENINSQRKGIQDRDIIQSLVDDFSCSNKYRNQTPKITQFEKEFLDEEDSYQYKSETEICKDDKFEIEISFQKDENKNKHISICSNQTGEILDNSLDDKKNRPRDIPIVKNSTNQNKELIKSNNINTNNQKHFFQPKIDEFYYDSYSKPPELRIDTTLVAQSNDNPSLRMSKPYQVSTISKTLESESDASNQSKEYILRDLIIASESESNYSKEDINQRNSNAHKQKNDHFNNRFSQYYGSEYSEVSELQKKLNKPQYSNISAINNDNSQKSKSITKGISLNKDKELVININISDKFNSTRNNNSIDIETPKQINNIQPTNFQRTTMNETSLSRLNDSLKMIPQQIKTKNIEIDKKLAISPSINIQKNQYDLNIYNDCPNISDAVIVRIDNEIPAKKSILRIQKTNSQEYLSTSDFYSNSKKNVNNNIKHQKFNANNSINDKNISHANHNNLKTNRNQNHPTYKKESNPVLINQFNNSKYSKEPKSKRGDSVPHHKSSHEEQKNNFREKDIIDNHNQDRENSGYEVQFHNDSSNNYIGTIVLRNGKYVRRVKVRKSQRLASVAPNNSNNRNINNNLYYLNRNYAQSPDNNQYLSSNQQNNNYIQYPSHNHNNSRNNNHYSNIFNNLDNYNYNHHHHHHHHKHDSNPNQANDYFMENEDRRGNDHQRRSSSANRIRTKKSQLYDSDKQSRKTNNNSNHHNRRSNSAPRKSTFPLYIESDKNQRNYNQNPNKDYDSDVDVGNVFSSDFYNGKEWPKRSSSNLVKRNVSTLTPTEFNSIDEQEIKPFSVMKEKETQTPKSKKNKNFFIDTFSSSECEAFQSKSVFLDLSQIEKKDEKSAKMNKSSVLSDIDNSQNMISSEKMKKNHTSKNWNSSQLNEFSDYSCNSQSVSRSKKRKRTRSNASSRSSISISMATPSPSASEIPTSDYEIIQTPLKDFVKNKNAFFSEISSQFQEEEAEEYSYIHFNESKKQINNNSEITRHQKDKIMINDKKTKENPKSNTKRYTNKDEIKNHRKENMNKNEKIDFSKLFDIASSSDDENDNRTSQIKDTSSEVFIQQESNSGMQVNNSSKKIKQIKVKNNDSSSSTSKSGHRRQSRHSNGLTDNSGFHSSNHETSNPNNSSEIQFFISNDDLNTSTHVSTTKSNSSLNKSKKI